MSRLLLRIASSSALVLELLGAGSTPPLGERVERPGLTVFRTPPASDSIDAEPEEAYVLSVSDEGGEPVVGTTVTFRGTNIEVAAPGGDFRQEIGLETDSRGETAVMVRFGGNAGRGRVVAAVPTLQLTDTLRLHITAGATVGPLIIPSDTTVVAGASFVLSARPVDRHGNPTGFPLDVTVDRGPVTVVGSELTGDAVGRARLSATAVGKTAYADVRVVPDGELVYTKGADAWLVRFDGSEARQLDVVVPHAREPSVSWDRAGIRIVLGGSTGFVVFDLGTHEVSPAVWPDGAAGSDVLWPRFGPADKVYYSSSDGHGAWDLREADRNGRSGEILIPSDRFPNNDFFPDWGPDGSRFTFTADWEERNRFVLRVADTSTDFVRTLGIEGTTPVWSPDGSLIAYQELGAVGVVSPDKPIHRQWNPNWSKGVTWSPRSDMLLGIHGGQIAILNVETGEELILGQFGHGIVAVAWRPDVPR